MAKDTAKKNRRKNEERMRLFTLITVAVNVITILVILYRHGFSPQFGSIVWLSFWAGQQYASLALLKYVAKPTYGPTGELVDCADVSDPAALGPYSLAQDLLWVCWAVEPLCCIVHWGFVFLYLPLPIYCVYKLSTIASLLRGPRSTSAEHVPEGQVPQTRAERRRLELHQRKRKL
ncbi:putative Protein of unknown function (DUF788) [Trypanosoma vivax]|uniref:Uncharacterized protein n=1 Tax=Trypanosoma vivax (strain Y486) TaxID=1055687 RepID=G0U206_TRYVY|nr:hypothetical protein TRVL_04747 [Trypanosoma vivax]KAH8618650.1 putative Protein of unknown function (DUF788) [Trypanosoma vivax]CCC50308.1 conserved hypothetical protein [Trypanosoma vivax Y486]